MVLNGNQTQEAQAQASPSDGGGTTGETQAETFTKAEVEKLISDRLATQGRSAKQLEQREQAIKQAHAEAQKLLDDFNKRAESSEREELENASPEERNLIEERQKIRRDKAELNQQKLAVEAERQSNAAELAESRTLKKERAFAAIVAKHNVDADILKGLIRDDDDDARIERYAAALPKIQRNTPRGDGGGTAGGTHQTITDIRKDYISSKINLQQYTAKCKALGIEP